MQVTSKKSPGGESGSRPGLRGPQHGFEYGGRGGAEGVGGWQPRLPGYPCDELFGLGFPEAPATKSEMTASTQMPHPAMMMPVCPVATNSAPTPSTPAARSISSAAVILPIAVS